MHQAPNVQGASLKAAGIRTLIGASIGMFLNPSSLLLLPFGVYLIPIVKDTGWSKAQIAASIGPALLLVGLMPPLVGWLTNYFGPRRFMRFAFPLCGAALMLLSTPSTGDMFAVTIAACGLLISGQTMVPYVYCVTGWFDKSRGLALGVILAATGLGVAVTPPIVAKLISILGWRPTLLAVGSFVVVVGVLVPRWLIVDPPAIAATIRNDVPGLTWRQALRTRVLWLLMGSLLLIGGAVSAGTINLYGILVERGIPVVQASFIMSLLGISMICARLIVGYLFDHVRPQWIAALIGLAVATAFLVLATTTGPSGVFAAAILIGIGFGAEGDVLAYLTSRAFGMREFGTIFGIVFLSFTMGGAIGPVVFARMGTAGPGGHMSALWLATACCVLGLTLILRIRSGDLPFTRSKQGPESEAAVKGIQPHETA